MSTQASNTSISAFPTVDANRDEDYGTRGMTLRDYFAARCPDSFLEAVTPKTIGDFRDALIIRGIIPADRAKGDVMRSYNEADALKLTIKLRWEYADAMLAAREVGR